jgi:hypothetical protein
MAQLTTLLERDVHEARISGSAIPQSNFVIASHGEMSSFPAGTTPFFPEIESARGSSVQEIPCLPDDQGGKGDEITARLPLQQRPSPGQLLRTLARLPGLPRST